MKISKPKFINTLFNKKGEFESKEKNTPLSREFETFANAGQIIPVFESGGRQYYKFADDLKIPALRAFAAKDVYQELEYKTTKTHMIAHFEAVEQLLSEGKLAQVIILNAEIRSRLDYITHIDLLYKLASVMYFDQSENPYSYDQPYNFTKIANWKKDNDIESFFLKIPFIDLMPHNILSVNDLPVYTERQRQIEYNQLKALLPILSKKPENKDLITSIQLQMATLENLIQSGS